MDPDEEYAPVDAVAVVSATRTALSGSLAIFGVVDGSTLWTAGSAVYQPNLGFGSEELDPADWVDGLVTVALTDFTGPEDFALYTTNLASTSYVDVYLSTFDATTTFGNNSFVLLADDHVHALFGFTAPGYYELELTWSGEHVVDGLKTSTGAFGFTVVPEPSTYALLGLGGLALCMLRFRRNRA